MQGRFGPREIAEPDADLRDTETVPLKESIEEYFKREVLPHVPDAWIDHGKTKVGYEIPLNRHFYRYEPPRPLDFASLAAVRGLAEEFRRRYSRLDVLVNNIGFMQARALGELKPEDFAATYAATVVTAFESVRASMLQFCNRC